MDITERIKYALAYLHGMENACGCDHATGSAVHFSLGRE